MPYRYVYGPVPSRRLGRSLGVSPIPSKTCNYSCVYCQLGRTDHMTNTRQDFFDPQEILDEIVNAVKENPVGIDYITFVGEGEPTLCKSIGYLMREARRKTGLPVAIITNGALLYDKDVRDDLMSADIVLPSLDAANEKTFLKINRSHREIKFGRMVEGLKIFAKSFKGKIWIEVMIVKNINDSEEELKGISKILEDMGPDRVYVNVPIRPPAEKWAEIPDEKAIAMAHEILHSYVIAGYEEGDFHIEKPERLREEILKICERHPMREDQIKVLAQKFSLDPDDLIKSIEDDPEMKTILYNGKRFFLMKPKRE